MRGAVLYSPGDVRVEDRQEPAIVERTDAVIRLSATCICGSDLWPYRGVEKLDGPAVMGHEYVGVVEEVGGEVTTVEPGQFVVGSFVAADGTCEICRSGYPSSCVNRVFMNEVGTQSERARIPLADGTLVATPGLPGPELVPSLLAASDVLGTGWFGAWAAQAGPGKTVAVVGDGAVGLMAVLAARRLGAERIIAMSRHSVVEAVGTQESMRQAIGSARPGGHVGFVGVNHDVALSGDELFFAQVSLLGGPAPVRRFLPELIELIWERRIDPGKVFDLMLPLEQAAEGYQAMDERRAIKVLLQP
ncbi:alcohol dehydrogenase catalytic domain-containing protein [Nonomuraea sp. NN258]|uniref:alcohol dehydrogenase catalytic domain-containing protein n=1 Tax=Nonomuraea antri TaxID=2730852 RepID=UPI001569C060|nr:alcohol dehydrogenase catalytic domain-containing protein [Nonomuraea antri]NRQ37080.1 alcohol dehydrogenase catalytic domain-containing protein [Nonomuraea antri]